MRRLLTPIIALALSVPALAQADDRNKKADKPGLSQQSIQWLETVAQGNQFQTQLSDIAEDDAKDKEVKKFAAKMKEHHEIAGDIISRVEKEYDLKLSRDLTREQKQQLEKLDKADGEQVDQLYLSAMVQGHQQAIDKFEKAKQLPDKVVKVAADSALPYLRYQSEVAQQLHRQVQTRPAGPAEETPGAQREQKEQKKQKRQKRQKRQKQEREDKGLEQEGEEALDEAEDVMDEPF